MYDHLEVSAITAKTDAWNKDSAKREHNCKTNVEKWRRSLKKIISR